MLFVSLSIIRIFLIAISISKKSEFIIVTQTQESKGFDILDAVGLVKVM